MDTETLHGGESRTALEAALDAAALMNPVQNAADERQWLVVPETHKAIDITDPLRLPSRIAQSVTLDDRAGLIAYANRFKLANSILLADVDAGRISALIDYHCETQAVQIDGQTVPDLQEGKARHNAHRALLALRHSEAFKLWNGFQGEIDERGNGKLHAQTEFAAFLEENGADVTSPDGSSLLEIVRDLHLVRDEKLTSKIDLTSGDLSLNFQSETQQLQKVTLPRVICLRLPIWEGEEPIDIECRLRWRTHSGVVALGIVMKRIEHIKRELFAKITSEIAEATGLPAMAGRI